MYAHPILTTVIVVSVIVVGVGGVTYIFYPQLLGYASAAGGLTTKQLLDEEIRKNRVLEEALAKATSRLAQTETDLLSKTAESIANGATNTLLQSSLVEKSAEVLVEQGLRVSAEANITALKMSLAENQTVLTDFHALLGTSQTALVEATTKISQLSTENAIEKAARLAAEEALKLTEGSLREAAKLIAQKSLGETAGELTTGALAEASARIGQLENRINFLEFLRIRSPAADRPCTVALQRILSEGPEHFSIVKAESVNITMSDERANFIAHTFMDSVKVCYNLLHRNPIVQDLPPTAVEDARGLASEFSNWVISTFFG